MEESYLLSEHFVGVSGGVGFRYISIAKHQRCHRCHRINQLYARGLDRNRF